LYFTLLVTQVFGHSWLDCTSVNSTVYTNEDDIARHHCNGFPRGYAGRDVDPDLNMIKIVDPNPALAACPGRTAASYTSTYPETQARPGQTLTMLWIPNGHTMWMSPPPPNGPRQVYIKWSGIAGQDLVTMNDVRNGLDFQPSIQFDTPCHNRYTGAQVDPSSGLCFYDYTIPSNLAPGTYQLVWWWPFDFAGSSVTEEYVSCWDVVVSGTAVPTSSGGNGATVSGSGTVSSGGKTTAATCSVGAAGCACTDGGACNKGLTCLSRVCVDASNLINSASSLSISFAVIFVSTLLVLFA